MLLEVGKKYKISDKYGNIYQIIFLGDTPKCAKIHHFRIKKVSYYDKDRFYKEHKFVEEIQ